VIHDGMPYNQSKVKDKVTEVQTLWNWLLSSAVKHAIKRPGLPVVLTFLKCHRCREIVLKLEIVLKFYSFGQNVLKLTFVMLS